ncbi:MAG: c-type cytochrome [Cytophagaceae bacterium]
MKTVTKIFLYLILFLAIVFTGLLLFVKFYLPDVGPAPDVKAEMTDSRIERGKYLANHVMVCVDCHSSRDWDKFSGPLIPGTEGMGGEAFTAKFGFPGEFYAKNITPAGLANWTDGEILRAISSGVNKDGKALFPIMPHPFFGKLDQEDLLSVIAYIRTLKPIENEVPESRADFPMNFIINTIPAKHDFHPIPSKSDTLAYGEYLITAATCMDCHTKQKDGKYEEGMLYAGGFEFPLPYGGVVRSANITPDPETGIGGLSKENFIRKFKNYADSTGQNLPVKRGAYNSYMPWTMYAGMTEEDLAAIYTYLMTVKPVKNQVIKFEN